MERILLKPGTSIKGRWYGGEYRVLKPIGSGGTAEVYLVRDLSDWKEYALKLGGTWRAWKGSIKPCPAFRR